MGGGDYSISSSVLRSKSYDFKSTDEIFQQRHINNAMNPYNVKIRESRDSDEHPESLAIIIALDVTGSMGSIPHYIIQKGLINIMQKLFESGIKDPQILFLGIGDHECDSSPLQVGQYESSDELLDKWLKDLYLEGGGGGNEGESYLLAWYFAGYRTSIDCFEKRNKKGFLFTIGDEPTLKNISKQKIKDIMGDGQYDDFEASRLLEKAVEKYNVFHININETMSGSRQDVKDSWKQLLQNNLLIAEKKEDVSTIIAEKIIELEKGTVIKVKETKKEDIIL